MNTLQSSFLIEVHQQDDKYSFTISNGVIDKTPLVISSYCFDRESECFNYIYSKVDLFLLDSSTTHLLTIIDRQYGGELCRYYLNHKRDSIEWDGIVRKVGDDAFAQCREDFIYGHSHLEPLLPETSIDKPQMVWGVVGINQDKDNWYYIKDAVVYANKRTATQKMVDAGKEFSVFGFELK